MLDLNWKLAGAAGLWAFGAGIAAIGFLGFAGIGPLAVELASLRAAARPALGLAVAAGCGRVAGRLAARFRRERRRPRWFIASERS